MPVRFIPFRKRDIVEMCVAAGNLDALDQARFRNFCRLLQSVIHFDYHARLEALKDSYACLDPNRDTRQVDVTAPTSELRFVDQLEGLLDKANYEQLGDEELQFAFRESSLFALRFVVNFDDFEETLIFIRGESTRTQVMKKFFGLVKRDLEFANFDRVVIYIKFADNLSDSANQQQSGRTLLKMFQNVPKADMEMLLPNTRVGMRLIDKVVIGVPAVLGGVLILTTKLGASLILLGTLFGFWLGLYAKPVTLSQAALIALAVSLGGLGSFIWKQFVNFKNRKLTFMQTLTESLYFRNLDNNAGVFHRLIDDAEEEECKEAILAYYFLLTESKIDTRSQLDDAIETWFTDRWHADIDFEVEDALAKLVNFGLVEEEGDSLRVPSIDRACEILDRRWDHYFNYAEETAAGAGRTG